MKQTRLTNFDKNEKVELFLRVYDIFYHDVTSGVVIVAILSGVVFMSFFHILYLHVLEIKFQVDTVASLNHLSTSIQSRVYTIGRSDFKMMFFQHPLDVLTSNCNCLGMVILIIIMLKKLFFSDISVYAKPKKPGCN